MPEIKMEAFAIMKTGTASGNSLRLQSKMVFLPEPDMFKNGTMLSMRMTGSANVVSERSILFARLVCMA